MDANIERWTLDAGLWTLGAVLWTPHAELWSLDTAVDWFRTDQNSVSDSDYII